MFNVAVFSKRFRAILSLLSCLVHLVSWHCPCHCHPCFSWNKWHRNHAKESGKWFLLNQIPCTTHNRTLDPWRAKWSTPTRLTLKRFWNLRQNLIVWHLGENWMLFMNAFSKRKCAPCLANICLQSYRCDSTWFWFFLNIGQLEVLNKHARMQ